MTYYLPKRVCKNTSTMAEHYINIYSRMMKMIIMICTMIFMLMETTKTDNRLQPTMEEADECCNQVRYIISILGHILFSRVRLTIDFNILWKRLMNAANMSDTSFQYLIIYYSAVSN